LTLAALTTFQSIDSKIHHNNLINNILAKIEGNLAQAEDAIMLDKDGFVSETNATNIFMVKKGIVLTPHAEYCLPGITRATVSLIRFQLENYQQSQSKKLDTSIGMTWKRIY
jgi:branched-subunit amino acid aminotransferase/4-amino-4-deoxychorismate lyase